MKSIIIPLLLGTLLLGAYAEKDYTDLVTYLKESIENPKLPFYHSAW